MALDLGKRYTGVAVSDPSQRVVFPREELQVAESELASLIQAGIEAEDVVGLLVGLPLGEDGEDTPQSQWVRRIIGELGIEIPIHFVDESYSSLNVPDLGGRKDSVVAQRLLENHLGLEHF